MMVRWLGGQVNIRIMSNLNLSLTLVDVKLVLLKYALKVHLLDWKYHYFPRGGGVWREPPCHYVASSLLA